LAPVEITPQPIGTWLQPVKLSGARERIAKKTYIPLPKYPLAALDKAFGECKADKSWTVLENTTSGHSVMINEPDRSRLRFRSGTAPSNLIWQASALHHLTPCGKWLQVRTVENLRQTHRSRRTSSPPGRIATARRPPPERKPSCRRALRRRADPPAPRPRP
jgi:hypothetical protein